MRVATRVVVVALTDKPIPVADARSCLTILLVDHIRYVMHPEKKCRQIVNLHMLKQSYLFRTRSFCKMLRSRVSS